MNSFNTYVGIVASLVGIAGTVAALLEKNKLDKKRFAIILSTLVVVIASGIFFVTSTDITPHPPTNPFKGKALPPTNTPTDTPTPTPTQSALTPTSSPVLHGPTTLAEQIRLQCNCSDPVLVTITQIVIEPQQNRMLWSLTLKNTSQQSVDASFFQKFRLQEGNQKSDPSPGNPTYNPTGPGVTNNLPLMNAGDSQQIVVTFSFVPYIGMPYTLDSQFIDGITSGGVSFDPIIVNFP